MKKETLTQVLSCEFCEIFKNNFFIEHIWWLLMCQINDSFFLWKEILGIILRSEFSYSKGKSFHVS